MFGDQAELLPWVYLNKAAKIHDLQLMFDCYTTWFHIAFLVVKINISAILFIWFTVLTACNLGLIYRKTPHPDIGTR